MPHVAERVTLCSGSPNAHSQAHIALTSGTPPIQGEGFPTYLILVTICVFQCPILLHLEVVWCWIPIEVLTATQLSACSERSA